MKRSFRPGILFALAASLLGVLPAARAQEKQGGSTVPVRTLVTITAKNGPPQVTTQDVLVKQGNARLVVTDVQPATGSNAGLQLAIVIDDSATSSLNNQLPDIAKFINGLGPAAAVGIYYASNGTVRVAQDFTTDHAQAAKALRIPLGRNFAYGSIFLSAMDLMKRWPASQDRREMLILSDGVDHFRGDPFSPDIDATAQAAQKAGIVLHTLFVNTSGRGGHGGRGVNRLGLGQSNLSRITGQTGGQSYFQGTRTPVDSGPFLDQLAQFLNNQYWVSYLAQAKSKPELQQIKFSTELPGVKIIAPDRVLIPAAQ